MSKLKRNERIGIIVKVLIENPNKVITFNEFSTLFKAAKSSISEDIGIVKAMMQDNDMGQVITISGAAGGVKYIPAISKDKKREILNRLCDVFSDKARLIAGGFLYIADILYNPEYIKGIAQIFAERFAKEPIDYVMTIETKGIPMAFMTATYLNVPLVIVRKNNKVTDGANVSINYVSGSSDKLGTMFVHKRAIQKGSNVLIIDDVMKGGGTIKGLRDLVLEFGAHVIGAGVLLEMDSENQKIANDYVALLKLEAIDEEKIVIAPNF